MEERVKEFYKKGAKFYSHPKSHFSKRMDKRGKVVLPHHIIYFHAIKET